jgi:hypothetical protein
MFGPETRGPLARVCGFTAWMPLSCGQSYLAVWSERQYGLMGTVRGGKGGCR